MTLLLLLLSVMLCYYFHICYGPFHYSEMDKQRNALIDAYVRLGLAQIDLLKKTNGEPVYDHQLSLQDVDNTVNELKQLVDLSDAKVPTCLLRSTLSD